MDNQHQKITGYRDFDQRTVDNINLVKATEAELAKLFKDIEQDGGDARSLAIARTQMQQSFMWLVRAIAKPADPFE